MLVNGKQLTVGVVGGEEVVLDKPMTPSEIQVGFLKYIFIRQARIFKGMQSIYMDIQSRQT